MADEPPARKQGFWLTAGEVVAVLALVVAGLNYWDTHQQRLAASRQAVSETQAETAFVARGRAQRGGEAILIAPVKSAEVITDQRYVFPTAVLASIQDISAAQPRIEAAWVATGLRHALAAARVKGEGHGRLPVILQTTYVEDGETHSDTSLYNVGYDWKPRLFGGERIRLDGLALVRRGGSLDRNLVNRVWSEETRAVMGPRGSS